MARLRSAAVPRTATTPTNVPPHFFRTTRLSPRSAMKQRLSAGSILPLRTSLPSPDGSENSQLNGVESFVESAPDELPVHSLSEEGSDPLRRP